MQVEQVFKADGSIEDILTLYSVYHSPQNCRSPPPLGRTLQ